MTCTLVRIKDISSLCNFVPRFKNINTGLKIGKILYGFILVFSLFSANSIFSGYGQPIVNVQEASAQFDPTTALFANPGTSDFLSLAIALVPTIQGADLNVSNVAGTTECNLLLPVTYIDGGCMSSLPLLTPITYQPNLALPVNETVYFTDYNQSSVLAVSIGLSSDNITAGETQTVTVTVSDENSTAPISGAVVDSNITDSYGTGVYEYSGVTDDTGQTTFDYAIPVDALSDFYDVTVYAYADGYDNATSSTVFEVIGSDYDDFYDNSTSDDYNYDDGNYNYDDGSSSDDNCCDYDSPTVKSVDPGDDENNVALDTKIKVTFDESMDKDTLDDNSIFIFNLDGVGVDEPNVNADPSDKSVTYTLDRQLEPGTRYEAELDFDIQDKDGNYLDCTDSNDVDSSCRWQFETTGTSTGSDITISPTSGPIGTTVTVTGTGFDASSNVAITFGGNTVTTNPTQITTGSNGGFTASFSVPTGSSGSPNIVATQGSNSPSKPFTVTGPSITLNPTSGPVGTPVTVTGSGFDPNSPSIIITFDDVQMTTVTPSSSGGFTANFAVPASASSGDNTVTATQGSKLASKQFTVTPAIVFEPSAGPVETSVEITGIGFEPDSTVTVNFDGSPIDTNPPAVRTDENGDFSASFKVPESNEGDQPVVAAAGDTSASSTFTVTSVADPLTIKSVDPKDEKSSLVIQNNSNVSSSSSKVIETDESSLTSTPEVENKSYNVESSSGSLNKASSSSETDEQSRKDRALFEEYLRSGDMGPEQVDGSEINIRPVAKADEAATVQNVPVSIDILANDKDADGKDDLKIIGTSPPNRGKVDLNSNDSITYFPEKDWAGTDVFDYTISDGKGGVAMASVAVKVGPAENNVPKVESETVSVNENNPERIKLKATDADGRDRLMFKIVKEPSHGKIAEFSSSDGTLTYLPERNYQGKDGFEFIVTDGQSESKEGQITIEIKPGKDLAEGEQAADQKQQEQQQEQKEQADQPQDKQSNGDSGSGDNTENKDSQQSSDADEPKEQQSEDQKQQDEQKTEPPKEDENMNSNESNNSSSN